MDYKVLSTIILKSKPQLSDFWKSKYFLTIANYNYKQTKLRVSITIKTI